jgi:iron complex transport system substrate-binding protein
MPGQFPSRIVCLTEETTETLYLLGAEDRIVGISGFTVRPPRARREKPKVSAFLSAKTDKILALEPDLVLGFSDLQADVANDLIKQGLNVVIFNQRSVQEILDMMLTLSGMLGMSERGAALIAEIEAGLQAVRTAGTALKRRPRVYFEEWDDPMISAIRWVSELIGYAGGEDCFAELSQSAGAAGRVVTDPGEVIRRRPDIIIGSWCGKRFNARSVAERPGWSAIPAVANSQLHEIKSAYILQPGPAALTDGVRQLQDIMVQWQMSGA